ncbi:MAG: DUF1275 domain-containing protein [Proteobacteria bacterium]|nr:DUF1275 domain-containing protein [Pseudomonadota bacterium]
MLRSDRRIQLIAACLSAVAGYVDAIGFLYLGGFFVSFMTGNSTRAGVGIAEGAQSALIAAGLVSVFVVGVVAGSTARSLAGKAPHTAVVALTCLLLIAAAVLGMVGLPIAAVVAMTLAMGAENTIFEKDGEVRIGLTYMTGTLVKLGQRIAAMLRGEKEVQWAPYLFHWLAMVGGAALGAFSYTRVGFISLLGAGLAMGCLIPAIRRAEP